MAYQKKTWLARLGQGLNKFIFNGGSKVTLDSSPDLVTQEGTPLSADNMNDLEQRIEDEFTNVNGMITSLCEYVNSEVIVGKWVDGSPIYRQVFTKSGLQTQSFDIGTITGGAYPLKVDGYGVWNNGQIRSFIARSPNTIGVYIDSQSGNIRVEPQDSSGWFTYCTQYVVIIEYIKP